MTKNAHEEAPFGSINPQHPAGCTAETTKTTHLQAPKNLTHEDRNATDLTHYQNERHQFTSGIYALKAS